MCEHVSKLSRMLKALYCGKLEQEEGGGAFKLTKESLEKDTAVPIWEESILPKLLCNVSQKMKKLLALFDVKEEDQSPFFSFHGDRFKEQAP